jgi:hypothetical protein
MQHMVQLIHTLDAAAKRAFEEEQFDLSDWRRGIERFQGADMVRDCVSCYAFIDCSTAEYQATLQNLGSNVAQ